MLGSISDKYGNPFLEKAEISPWTSCACGDLIRSGGTRHRMHIAIPLRDVLAMTCLATSAWAISGAEVLKQLNHDSDQTLEIPEVIDAATKLFYEINPDHDTTLERKATVGRLTEADWKAVNKDHDNTIKMDEWLTVARQRFNAADANKDGKLTAKELDSPAGQELIKMIVK